MAQKSPSTHDQTIIGPESKETDDMIVPTQSNGTATPNTVDPTGTQVYITFEAWQRLQTYVRACRLEINGFGLVRKVGKHSYLIDEVFIIEQEVSSGHANTVMEQYHAAVAELVARGDDSLNRFRFQWHSHVNIEAFPSGVDTNFIERLDPYLWISVVTNRYGDVTCRVDIKTNDFKFAVYVPLQIWAPTPPELIDEITKEVLDKVTATPLRKRNGNEYEVVLDDDNQPVYPPILAFGEDPDDLDWFGTPVTDEPPTLLIES